jgi:hypothetical protein
MRPPLLAAALLVASCSSSPPVPAMERSCRGEIVDVCDPYAWAAVTAATLGPAQLRIGDPTTSAMVHVELSTCAMAPARPSIQINALVGSTSGDASLPPPIDGGASTGARIVSLATIPSSAVMGTSVDTTIPNPFFADVPPSTAITLQFVPVIAGCQGDAFQTPYTTGVNYQP